MQAISGSSAQNDASPFLSVLSLLKAKGFASGEYNSLFINNEKREIHENLFNLVKNKRTMDILVTVFYQYGKQYCRSI